MAGYLQRVALRVGRRSKKQAIWIYTVPCSLEWECWALWSFWHCDYDYVHKIISDSTFLTRRPTHIALGRVFLWTQLVIWLFAQDQISLSFV